MRVDADIATGLVNQLLFDIDTIHLHDGASVAARATAMIDGRVYRQPVGVYLEAIRFMLSQGTIPAQTLELSERFAESELLDYLDRLAHHLEQRRPWPRPLTVKLDVAVWPTFANAKPVAQLNRPTHQVCGRLRHSFDEVSTVELRIRVMILELRSGDVVALAGAHDPRSRIYTLLQRDPGDSADLVARFCEYTGFGPADVTPLTTQRRD